MSDQETTVVDQVEASEAVKETSPAPVEDTSTSIEDTETITSTSAETPASPVEAESNETITSTPDEADASSIEAESTEDTSAGGALSIHSLQIGQRLTGTVKNLADFGAFVDIGIAQDGLVHISELARQKVDKVTDVVSQGQEVDVWVKKVDTKRGRISLTMIKPIALKLKDIAEDAELEGVVSRLEPYGAFVDIGTDRDGLVHISQITHDYIKHPEDILAVDEKVKVKVLKVNRKKRQVDLSIKALLPPPAPPEETRKVEEAKSPPRQQEVTQAEDAFDDEPVPTAMAIAYAALQGEPDDKSEKNAALSRNKSKRKKEMDDIVARTLANRS